MVPGCYRDHGRTKTEGTLTREIQAIIDKLPEYQFPSQNYTFERAAPAAADPEKKTPDRLNAQHETCDMDLSPAFCLCAHMCACVCACVRARAYACACVRMCAYVLIRVRMCACVRVPTLLGEHWGNTVD